MLLDGNKFEASMNSVVLIVDNIVTRPMTILFDDFFTTSVKKLLAFIRLTTMLYYNINVKLKPL